jgi:hypothetical protein
MGKGMGFEGRRFKGLKCLISCSILRIEHGMKKMEYTYSAAFRWRVLSGRSLRAEAKRAWVMGVASEDISGLRLSVI